MVRAILNGEVVADSAAPVTLEGNYYFPPDSVKRDLFEASETQYARISVICDATYNLTTCYPSSGTIVLGKGALVSAETACTTI